MDNYGNTIGQRIRDKRKQLGITQAELANQLQITNKAVSKWETGESMPDILLLPKLSEILRVSTDELLGVPSVEANESLSDKPAERIPFKIRIKRLCLVVLSVISFLLSLLFVVSLIFAFDKDEVASATGNVSDQIGLIILSVIFASLFGCLFYFSFRALTTIRLQFAAVKDKKVKEYCQHNGYKLYSELSKEEKKQLRKEFAREKGKIRVVVIVGYSCIMIALIALRLINLFTGLAPFGYIAVILAYGLFMGCGLVNSFQWKKWLLKRGVFLK